MKKIALLLTLVFGITLLAGCNQTANTAGSQGAAAPANRLERILADGQIVMATSPDFAPFIFMHPERSGQEAIIGSDAELARHIASELGVELVIESMDFGTSLAAVQAGTVDMFIGGLAWREDRAEAMMLSSSYLPPTFQGIMVLAEQADELRVASDFDGLTIGAQNASLQQDNVENQLPNANLQLVTTVSDGIMMLLTGSIDALAMSGTVGEQYVRNYPMLAMSDFHFELHPNLGQVIAMPNGSQELFDAIEEILAYINENGLYDVWFEEANAMADEFAMND
ncbi:MAG: transporter substrate-binding domain-containing protein [Defluviitaleaceae bacterium]|nr:transporter substrate-binding domain-containing protein [Defluviitaleaceae bacterium]